VEKYKEKKAETKIHSVGLDKSATHLAAAKWKNGRSEATNGRARIVTHIFLNCLAFWMS